MACADASAVILVDVAAAATAAGIVVDTFEWLLLLTDIAAFTKDDNDAAISGERERSVVVTLYACRIMVIDSVMMLSVLSRIARENRVMLRVTDDGRRAYGAMRGDYIQLGTETHFGYIVTQVSVVFRDTHSH